MLSWLLVIILAYLFFSLSSFGDKLVLSGPSSPKLYVFFVGLLGIIVLLLVPFVPLSLPDVSSLIWIILEQIAFLLAVYFMFSAVKKFDVSRVVPAVGSLQPIFVFFLAQIFFKPEPIRSVHFLAFLILLLGSFIVSLERSMSINKDYSKLIILSSFLFSLDIIFLKLVFLHQPFLQGLIWTRIFGFLFVMTLFLDKKFRGQIFVKREIVDKKTGMIVLFTQSCGAIAGLLQNFSVSLVPVAYLAMLNALRGVQYVFLFIMTLIFSSLFPKILKEEISKRIIFQKVTAIFFIIIGLLILMIY